MHRTNRRAHIFSALVAICAALAFLLTPLPAQALSTNSFYTGTKPGGGSRVNDAPLTAETGVTYALYYTDDSGQVSNYANVIDTDVNRMDKSVADVDLVRNLRAVLVVTNPGDGPISFYARLSTPYADYAGGGTDDRPLVRVSGAASFASTDDASEAYASLEADSGSTDPALLADAAGAYAATNAWGDLKRVTLSGSIQPGETLTVTLPLELTNETRAVASTATALPSSASGAPPRLRVAATTRAPSCALPDRSPRRTPAARRWAASKAAASTSA